VSSGGRKRGFTLIEVLVALVIVALGMGAVLTALTSAAQSTTQLRERSFAEWVGFNQLATVRLARSLPPLGKSDGDVDYADSSWHWQQVVTDMDVPGLKRIVIQVWHVPDPKADDSPLATVAGFRGDALRTALGVLSGWDNAAPPSGPAGDAKPGGTPGMTNP
jgi:general secretion pathway protein I